MSNLLHEHLEHIGSEKTIASKKNILVGDVIQFTYLAKLRTVFVLNPDYDNKLHGLTLAHISRHTLKEDIVRNMKFFKDQQQFYESYVNKPHIVKLDCYRIYKWPQIRNPRKLLYDYTA